MADLNDIERDARVLERTNESTDTSRWRDLHANLQKEVRDFVSAHKEDKAGVAALKSQLDSDHGKLGHGEFPDINIEVDKNGNLLGMEVRNEFSGRKLAESVVGNQQQFDAQRGQFEQFQQQDHIKRADGLDRSSQAQYKSENALMDPNREAAAVANVVKNYKASGVEVRDENLTWASGKGNVIDYLGKEEGSSTFHGKILRSGHEGELYHKIEDYVKTHDITDPAQKISPEQLMQWSLDVNKKDNSVSLQDALLTVHNVTRALARGQEAEPKNLPPGDPVRQILLENQTFNPHEHNPQLGGVYGILQEKYGYRGKPEESRLFERDEPLSIFKPTVDDAYDSAGATYHFWGTAFGAAALGPMGSTISGGGSWFEEMVVKQHTAGSAPATGFNELPWDQAGVQVYKNI